MSLFFHSRMCKQPLVLPLVLSLSMAAHASCTNFLFPGFSSLSSHSAVLLLPLTSVPCP